MKNKISLAGDLGSGKSTVSAILIERLGAAYYSTGSIVRSIAERMGMTAREFNEYMETHPEIDNEIDDGLKALSYDPRPLVIDSRMAWHFVEGTFRVYMTTDAEVSALRIMYANRSGEHVDSLEATVRETRLRRESEKKRYLAQYGTDITDLNNYDFVVDTTAATPDEVAGAILDAFCAWADGRDFPHLMLSSDRMAFPDDEPDADRLMQYSDALDAGESLPPTEVFLEDGCFYISGEPEAALAHTLAALTYIPARLVSGSSEGRSYVRMKNSL
ncbi:MAG: cytidylate kinase family protein [Clostridia bacterium]|nr:cytidylate kinase family protein [Clostridia bacterium]